MSDDAEELAYIEKMRIVFDAISPWRKSLPRGKETVVACPICKGKLYLSQSAYNGHVHGQCETDGCVEWME